MSQDMLGSLVRALVTVPEDRLGLVLDLTHKLGGRDGLEWKEQLTRFNKKGSDCWAPKPKSKTGKVSPPPKLVIDRTYPFDPVAFFEPGWSMWKGPANGDGLSGDEEQDKRSLLITELDVSKLTKKGNFLTGLESNESVITGEKKLARLSPEAIQADAKIAEALYREEGQKILRFIYDTLGVTWIEFFGTILRRQDGSRCVLALCRRPSIGEWTCDDLALWGDHDAASPALSFAGPAPFCRKCGYRTVHNDGTFKCFNCGESMPLK